MSKNGVSLAAIPDMGDELEDYVAALFQSSGYYVEKSLVERDPDDVLELDIVATDYSQAPLSSIIVEAKGGKWGYPDIFKVLGWMQYLSQPRGAFFVKSDAGKDCSKVQARAKSVDITFVHLNDFADVAADFRNAGLGEVQGPGLVTIWRYSAMIERALIKSLQSYTKANQNNEGLRAALQYQRLVNDGIFFTRSFVGTLEALYDAYKDHPRLTLAAALELEGKPFNPHTPLTPSPLLSSTLRNGDSDVLQASLYTEHRARLALLRGAVNLCCLFPEGYEKSLEPGSPDWSSFYSLPGTFRSALEWLRKQPTFNRYALLWQQFLWGWGGFYLSNKIDEEFERFSRYSGIPVGEIPQALTAFDEFFPGDDGGWLISVGPTDIRQVKMFPMVFKGLGAHFRRHEYDDEELTAMGSARYTRSDMIRWINRSVEFLVRHYPSKKTTPEAP